jgi:hypothetical protein
MRGTGGNNYASPTFSATTLCWFFSCSLTSISPVGGMPNLKELKVKLKSKELLVV